MVAVTLHRAVEIIDSFEQLLADNDISIPRHPQTGADMLPFWKLLDSIKKGAFVSPQRPQDLCPLKELSRLNHELQHRHGTARGFLMTMDRNHPSLCCRVFSRTAACLPLV